MHVPSCHITHSFVYPLITAASDCRMLHVQTRAHNKTLAVKVVKAVLPVFFSVGKQAVFTALLHMAT